MKVWALGALSIVASGAFTGCSDEIAEESRFTFTGELIADHLKNNPGKYRNFCKILEKARIGKKAGNMLTTLSTYGSYTCIAPTNEAIEEFLEAKYQEYIESVELHNADPDNYKIVNTGVTSPYLEDLSDSMATVIAKNHIIEEGFSTIDIGEGAFGKKTMNRRDVTLGWNKTTAEPTIDGFRVVAQDVETENGYIQGIEGVLAPSDKQTSDLLAMQPAFSLFSEALLKTGFSDILLQYEIDPDYDPHRNGPEFNTCGRKEEPPYPEFYNHGFTLLVETDELLADSTKNALGIPILTIEDLEWYAAQWYGTNVVNPDSFDLRGEYKNPNNPLYKYIAYHIIDRKLKYKSGKGPGGFIMEGFQTMSETNNNSSSGEKEVDPNLYNSEENLKGFDRYDYFETKLPFTSIKVTKPFSNITAQYTYHNGETGYLKDQIILNYAQEDGTRMCVTKGMEHHVNVVVENDATTKLRPRLEEFQHDSPNGTIFTIDKILIYNEAEMAGNILNERMRWDVSSLFPELTTNDVRWQPVPKDNSYYTIYIPAGFSKRLRHRNESTHFLYYRPYKVGLGVGNYGEDIAPGAGGGYANYMGDEVLVIGKYDFEYRLPYVPEGRYEIRFGFSTSDVRGVAQFYFDNKICGIPLDMRNSNFSFFGWVKESDSEEENRKNDKAMRNRGFMKAPASIFGSYNSKTLNLRHAPSAFRRIIGTYDLEYGKDYWLRFKDVTEGSNANGANEFNQDYLEIVPVGIMNDLSNPEDIY